MEQISTIYNEAVQLIKSAILQNQLDAAKAVTTNRCLRSTMVWDTSISVRGFEVTKGRVCTMLSRWEQQGMVERFDRGVYKKPHRQEGL